MSEISEKYKISHDTYIQMVKDGIISTDVILQYEYVETFKILSETMEEEAARNETLAHFCIHRQTLWRAMKKFGGT